MTRRRGPALVLALAACGVAVPARADAQAALADFKAGRYLEASAEIQAVVDRSPGYAWGHFLLGHCMLKMKHIANAEFHFRRALAIDPTRPEYFQGFALALSATGNWPLTIRAASEGLGLQPEPRTRFALLSIRGYAWGALRRWDDAIADLELAQRIHSQPWLFALLGKAHFAAGKWSDAVESLTRVLRTSPDDPPTLRMLAECSLRMAADEQDPAKKQAGYAQALVYARQLVAATPNDLDAVNLIGRAALGAGNLDQAESVFRHVLAINPRQCYALTNLGRTYMAATRWAEAEAALRRASACAPRLVTVYQSLGDLYLEIGKPEEAAEAFRRIEEIEPSRDGPGPNEVRAVFSPR